MNSLSSLAVMLCALGLLLCPASARAQLTALTVSGSPASMIISTAVAGAQPAPRTNNATTYFVKAKNGAGAQKITAHINALMPTGTTLKISLVPSSGATSLGAVSLDLTARDIVVNISKENGATNTITYTFSATVAAGVVPVQSRIVTLTLTSYP